MATVEEAYTPYITYGPQRKKGRLLGARYAAASMSYIGRECADLSIPGGPSEGPYTRGSGDVLEAAEEVYRRSTSDRSRRSSMISMSKRDALVCVLFKYTAGRSGGHPAKFEVSHVVMGGWTWSGQVIKIRANGKGITCRRF